MIDCDEIKWRCSSCHVYFKNLPDGILRGAIYIENEYHVKMNRYLRIWGWMLQRFAYWKYYTRLTYLPKVSKERQWKLLQYQFPSLSKELLRKIPSLKTTDLLAYLEDPDDARFMKPGFLFHYQNRDNGITVYEYYPMAGLDIKVLSYIEQINEILKSHNENALNRSYTTEGGHIGRAGLYSSDYEKNEDYADNKFEPWDSQTQAQIFLFQKQAEELLKCGVPMNILERILHQNDQLSKLVITKKYEIILPDYNNMVIKMEPLVKAIFLLFLKHPEGIIFKHLPDYRQELIDIYKKLRPFGLNERSLQSIEDVTNPLLNSINEKCARIRSAFVNKFDKYLAKNYCVTGERGEAKKIILPRDLVIWE